MVLLDARPMSDWQRSHLPGALPMPFYDGIDELVPHLPNDGHTDRGLLCVPPRRLREGGGCTQGCGLRLSANPRRRCSGLGGDGIPHRPRQITGHRIEMKPDSSVEPLVRPVGCGTQAPTPQAKALAMAPGGSEQPHWNRAREHAQCRTLNPTHLSTEKPCGHPGVQYHPAFNPIDGLHHQGAKGET